MDDVIITPIWLVATGYTGWCGWRTGQLSFPTDTMLQKVGHATLFFWSHLVVGTLLVGSVGLLHWATLLTIVPLLATATRFVVTQHSALNAPSVMSSLRLTWPRAACIFAWGAWLAVSLARHIDFGLLTIPTEWDTLMYHLPLINQWLQARGLNTTGDAVWYSPGNAEVMGLWMTAPFSGDFLISLMNIPATTLLAITSVEFGRQLGLRSFWAHAVGIALVSHQIAVSQMFDARNDLAVASLCLCALAYGVRYASGGPPACVAGAAVGAGLLFGIKYYAIGYFALVGLGLVGLVWGLRGRRQAFFLGGSLIASVLVLAGYWYGRNLAMTGSPVYPMGLFATSDVIHRVRPDVWRTTLLFSGRDNIVYTLLLRALWNIGGVVYYVAFLAFPAVAAWLLGSGFWLALHRVDPRHGNLRCWLVALTIGAGMIWGVTPFAIEHTPGSLDMLQGGRTPFRYGLCFLSLSLVCLVLGVQDALAATHSLPRPFAIGITAVVFLAAGCALALTQAQWILRRPPTDLHFTLLVSLNVGLIVINVGVTWFLLPRLRCWIDGVVMLAVISGSIWAVESLQRRWHDQFAQRYDRIFGGSLFRDLDDQFPAATQVCVAGYRYYPFFGSRRHLRAARLPYLPTYDALLEYLEKQHAELFAVVNEDEAGIRPYHAAIDWSRQHPDVFRLWCEYPHYTVWAINPEGLATARLAQKESTSTRVVNKTQK